MEQTATDGGKGVSDQKGYELSIDAPPECAPLIALTAIVIEELYKEIAVLYGAPGLWLEQLEQKLVAKIAQEAAHPSLAQAKEALHGLIMFVTARLMQADWRPGDDQPLPGDEE